MNYSKQEKIDFYQSKYEYYKKMVMLTVIFSSLANITYWISDCLLFNRLAWETLIPRLFMTFLLIFYLPIFYKVKNYKIMVPLTYLMEHGVMWCTIWAIIYLPNKTHASEGFIIMHIMFLIIGFCAPFKTSVIFHSGVILNILISNLFNHYENLDIMLSLGIPLVISIEALMFFLDKNYLDHYETKKELEKLFFQDNLTKAYNRNILDKLKENKNDKFIFDKVGILILDIDFFKKVNDTYGHLNGDRILKDLVNIINNKIDNSNYVVRFGGEEFMIILPNSNKKEVKNIGENIRKSVEDFKGEICNFTISIGATMYEDTIIDGNKDETITKAIQRADTALYKAKENGRNQLILN